jgi:hypothetical protein
MEKMLLGAVAERRDQKSDTYPGLGFSGLYEPEASA